MSLIKKILKSTFFHKILVQAIYLYISFAYRTTKWEVIGKIPDHQVIFALWHSYIIIMPIVYRDRNPLTVITSSHRDGQIVSDIFAKFGHEAVRGSSRKDGTQALIGALKAIKAGRSLGIIPDGPKGPARKLKGALVEIARKTGVPIVVVNYEISRKKILNTWDKMIIPIAFSHGKIYFSEEFTINKADNIQQKQLELEEFMKQTAY